MQLFYCHFFNNRFELKYFPIKRTSFTFRSSFNLTLCHIVKIVQGASQSRIFILSEKHTERVKNKNDFVSEKRTKPSLSWTISWARFIDRKLREWFKPPSSTGPVIGTTRRGRLMLTSHSPVQTSCHLCYPTFQLKKISLSDSEASKKLATPSVSVSAHICTATSPYPLVLQLIFFSLCFVTIAILFLFTRT